jgi:hypothetical protein
MPKSIEEVHMITCITIVVNELAVSDPPISRHLVKAIAMVILPANI